MLRRKYSKHYIPSHDITVIAHKGVNVLFDIHYGDIQYRQLFLRCAKSQNKDAFIIDKIRSGWSNRILLKYRRYLVHTESHGLVLMSPHYYYLYRYHPSKYIAKTGKLTKSWHPQSASLAMNTACVSICKRYDKILRGYIEYRKLNPIYFMVMAWRYPAKQDKGVYDRAVKNPIFDINIFRIIIELL